MESLSGAPLDALAYVLLASIEEEAVLEEARVIECLSAWRDAVDCAEELMTTTVLPRPQGNTAKPLTAILDDAYATSFPIVIAVTRAGYLENLPAALTVLVAFNGTSIVVLEPWPSRGAPRLGVFDAATNQVVVNEFAAGQRTLAAQRQFVAVRTYRNAVRPSKAEVAVPNHLGNGSATASFSGNANNAAATGGTQFSATHHRWIENFAAKFFACAGCGNLAVDPVVVKENNVAACRLCTCHLEPDVAELPVCFVQAAAELRLLLSNAGTNQSGRKTVRVRRTKLPDPTRGTAVDAASAASLDVRGLEEDLASQEREFLIEHRLQLTDLMDHAHQVFEETSTEERMALIHLAKLFKHEHRARLSKMREGSKALKNKADEKYEASQYATAVELYTKAIEANATDGLTKLATLHGNRSAAYYMSGQYQEALNDCHRVLELDPESVKMYQRAAKCAVSLGDLELAKELFSKMPAEKMTPSFTTEREKIHEGARVLEKAKRAIGTSEGDEMWLMLVDLYSEQSAFRLMCAEHFAIRKMYPRVIETLSVLVGVRRTHHVALALAKAMYMCGFEHFERARTVLEPHRATASECAEWLQLINVVDDGKQQGNMLFSQRKFGDAATCYTKAIDAAKGNDQIQRILYCHLAAAHKELGRFPSVQGGQAYKEGVGDHDVSNRLRAEAEARQAAIVAELYANFECTICCKSAQYDQKAIFNCCQGVACRDCATHFLLEAMHRPAIQCMFCQSPDLIGQDAQLILSDDRYELFARCRQNAEVTAALNATAVRCRAINCRGIVEREDLGLPNTASTAPHHFVCTVDPGHQWCLQCDVPWHVDSSCEQYQECRQNNDRADELMMELLERMGWKRCPTCRQGVERLPRTCNVVNCPTCRGNMCYLCEAVLDANTAVAHMHYGVEGHPCYAKCFFGCGIDDDAEPAAAPDVA